MQIKLISGLLPNKEIVKVFVPIIFIIINILPSFLKKTSFLIIQMYEVH